MTSSLPVAVNLGRAPYNFGHAAFEFIRDKYGDAAVRQFWFYMKKATLLGAEDVIASALGVKEEVFNEQFSLYLRERFKDFRDKQSPIDYGREVMLPKKYFQVFSAAPSPNGQQFAVMTANREDYEFDILIIDRSGQVLKNLTAGFTTRYDYLTTDSFRFDGRNLSWSSDGKRIAYFARTGKRRSLFIVDAQTGSRYKQIHFKLDQAASPALSPDGRTVLITAIQNGQPDLYSIDIETEKLTDLTNDMLFEKTPSWSPDGKTIFYTSRINSRDQIMRMNASNPKQVEQLTSSDYDSISPYFDPRANTIYFASDKNGAYNIYGLDLNTSDKLQYTDVIGGNFSPVVFYQGSKDEIAFTSFFKGEYRYFIMDLPKPVTIIAKNTEPKAGEVLQMTAQQALDIKTSDLTPGTTNQGGSREFPAQGPVISDFRPSKNVIIDKDKIQKKGFRPVIAGRPEVITGVSGDTFAVAGGVAIQDILGDQEFRFFTSRVRGFQSYDIGYLDLGHRNQFLTDFIFNDNFFFGPLPGPVAAEVGFASDIVKSRIVGGRYISQYPLNRYYRLELGAGIFDLTQEFDNPAVQELYQAYLNQTGYPDILSSGGYMPLDFGFVGETTRFREFGPIAGHTFRIGLSYAPNFGNSWVSRVIYDADLRKYIRMSNSTLIALRARGFGTQGNDPVVFSYGGGLDIRGFNYQEVTGNRGYILNGEYRFPLFPNPRVPVLGQMRGKVFVDNFRIEYLPEFNQLSTSSQSVGGVPFLMNLKDGAGSIGGGFSAFLGGLPMNFEFSKVYGRGWLANSEGRININQPTTFHFVDDIKFDFSIFYDF